MLADAAALLPDGGLTLAVAELGLAAGLTLAVADLMLAAADPQDSNAAVLLPLDYYLAALPCLILDI